MKHLELTLVDVCTLHDMGIFHSYSPIQMRAKRTSVRSRRELMPNWLPEGATWTSRRDNPH